jgi:hypothetical protein
MQIGQEEQEHPIENETKRDEGEEVSTYCFYFSYLLLTNRIILICNYMSGETIS